MEQMAAVSGHGPSTDVIHRDNSKMPCRKADKYTLVSGIPAASC